MHHFDLPIRPRRLRKNRTLRELVRETSLSPKDFIYPLFIKETLTEKKAINSMPGLYQYPLSEIGKVAKEVESLGIPGVILFAIPKNKDETGEIACQENTIITQAIKEIKSQTSKLLVITDLCFCEYTSHGHCGIINVNGELDNDLSLTQLQKQALVHAKAGADIIAPSGMLDGMIKTLRQALDKAQFSSLPILSYAVKYQSSLYGPFREAAEGAPQFGDRSTYQMDIANSLEALREAKLDIKEGADMLMVKPASFYLDIIANLKNSYPEIPLCAYQVSGEYAMIKAASKQGIVNEKEAMFESLIAIKRAGARFMITYFAIDACKALL